MFDHIRRLIKLALRKKSPYSELFLSTFSRIRTEYGEIAILWISFSNAVFN